MLNSSSKAICSRGFIPNIISVRYRRVNVQKPRKPDHYRAVIETISIPKYPWPKPSDMPWSERCPKPFSKAFKQIENNPYENILAKELRELFEQSAMVAIFHKNPVKGEIDFKTKKTFKMAGMEHVVYGKSTLNLALADTNYAAVLDLFQSHSSIVFSSTSQVPKLLKITKKMPHLILLATIIDGKLLSKNQTIEYGNLVNIDNARAALIGVIQQVNNRCLQTIGQTQLTMVRYLEQYGKSLDINTEKKSTEESD
ncbi:39S ribosomal protein L10, mitochondrial [Melanaphis sacchari]|uniref:Large ribosomal subunit protein uL10m n=1 Tax=Melanaphis sacchari TaxID=742174 RepID=A0A2H8TL26_9HEMI|nr:39S ribosomal protein L10, mitochondrial [Melanaphis sacchari]